jgi:phospholipase/carboxylesterase
LQDLKPPNSSFYNWETAKLAHENALFIGATPQEASILCVVVHGRTQSPEIMKDWVLDRLNVQGVAFALPRATGNSWYNAKAVDPLNETTRAQLNVSLGYLGSTIDHMKKEAGSEKPLMLIGFSQGACLSIEYAFRRGPWHGSLACLTGCRVGTQDDDLPLTELASLPVYLTGSDNDPWIPVSAFAEASHAFGRARARLKTELFPGRDHSISDAEIAELKLILSRLQADQQTQADAAA